MTVQLIERNGQPEWAVLPYDEYLRLVEQAEMLEDIQDFDRIKAAVENGVEEVLPSEVAFALLDGENPIKTWRDYRKFSMAKLAETVGISVPYLSQIETGKRKPSTKVLVDLARILHTDIDDLISK